MNGWELAADGIAIAICAVGGIACVVLPERRATTAAAIVCCSASLLATVASAGVLADPSAAFDRILWSLPVLGPLAVGMTPLGALFTCITALVYVPTSIYTVRYMERYEREYSARTFAMWFCVLLAAILSVLICRDATSFFVVWEIVAIASSALVAYEWRQSRNARAAYVMLAMSEAGTVAAILAVLLALNGAHSLLFGAQPGNATSNAWTAWAVFTLSFFGFGVKAGLLPVNSWLPRAHPLAPGNVSALLSGVILNLGVYGIVLVNLQLAPVRNPAEGVVVVIVGTLSAIIGILYATIEDDLKAMLAYSSIENLGIAVTALGVGFVFLAEHRMALAAIGLAAGTYHLVNHSAYKGLLFLGAATVDVKMGTRAMNRLGGVIRYLPITAGLFLVGALAIAAIPPFNGFVSEWMTFQALLRSAELSQLTLRVVFALCGAVLALTAALAVTCFVKAFGMTFLGRQRAPVSKPPTEASASMTLGMGILALECALLGILPTYVLPVIDRGLAPILRAGTVTRTLVPPFFAPYAGPHPLPSGFVATFRALGAQIGIGLPGRGFVIMLRGGSANPVVFAMSTTYLLCIIAALLAITYAIVRLLTRRRRTVRAPSWAGGLVPLLPEMTYTATGFSNPVRVIFDAVFHPTEIEDERDTIHEHFRSAIRRAREDVFLADRVVGKPATGAVLGAARALARMHHGRLPVYVGYALATLVVTLTIVSLR